MYNPPSFREERPKVLQTLIRQNSFGTLVSASGGELVATHLPFLLDTDRGPHGTLIGHMARANGQWRTFEGGGEVLVLFQGPHAYISPSWYTTALSVPTWNYVAVHAYGCPRLVEGAALHAILEATVREFEEPRAEPWRLAQLPDDFVQNLMRAIVGFEIPISRLEGKRKLSQNRPDADRLGAVDGLRGEHDPASLSIADLMASLPTERAIP